MVPAVEDLQGYKTSDASEKKRSPSLVLGFRDHSSDVLTELDLFAGCKL